MLFHDRRLSRNNTVSCSSCHTPPEFDIVPNSRNNGVITKIGGGTDLANTRSPSLRDLSGPGGQSNGPFMHDGSFTTLAQVINHYNLVPGNNANLDNRLRRPGGGTQSLNLTQLQKDDLAAFLATLTGSAVYTDEKWSDPFDSENRISLIVLPADSMRITDHGNGTATVSCAAVSAMSYRFESSTDLKKWSAMATITAGADGVCQYPVAVSGTRFYRYAYEPPAP